MRVLRPPWPFSAWEWSCYSASPAAAFALDLGLKAIERGYRVLFTTTAQMMTTLTKALAEGRVDERLKLYTVPRLLIIDEIGYLSIPARTCSFS